MMRNIVTSSSCIKQMTIMAWVALGVGTLSLATAMATNHWLRRKSNGDHVGIFPCCTKLQCGQSIVSCSGDKIEAFTDVIIIGVLLVGLGWMFSLTHACVTWRSDRSPFFGISYVGPGFVTIGGLTLLASAIEFVATIPGDLEADLKRSCPEETTVVDTGFSYELFVTGAVAFIFAGVLLLLGSCKDKSNRPSHEARLSNRRVRRSTNTPVETVAARLESQDSAVQPSSLANFNNPMYSNGAPVIFTAEQQRIFRTNQLRLTGDHPHRDNGLFQLPVCPPPYESIDNFWSHSNGHLEACERANNTSQSCCSSSLFSEIPKPPTYEDILKEQPPPYSDSK